MAKDKVFAKKYLHIITPNALELMYLVNKQNKNALELTCTITLIMGGHSGLVNRKVLVFCFFVSFIRYIKFWRCFLVGLDKCGVETVPVWPG